MLKVRYEIAFTWISLAVVLGSFGFYLAQGAEAGWHSLETFVFLVVVALLISGNVVYHVSRLGYLYRRRTHRAVSRESRAIVGAIALDAKLRLDTAPSEDEMPAERHTQFDGEVSRRAVGRTGDTVSRGAGCQTSLAWCAAAIRSGTPSWA